MEGNNIWLVNLPHAGGSSIIFKGWNKKVNCKVLNIEYPGHWTRMNEALLSSFEELVIDIIKSIQNKIQPPANICLFGHSLGAIISWWIVPILQKLGYTVKCIFLSASQSPNFFPEKNILDLKNDTDKLKLIDYEMKNYSVSVNNQFIKTFLPILNKDLQICKEFVSDEHYVNVDTIILYGKQDSLVEIDKMETWKNYTKLISIHGFQGHHLYLEDKNNKDLLIDMINKKLENIIAYENAKIIL